jgi:serine phosphatase RsbU (regulator of sigma subunit)
VAQLAQAQQAQVRERERIEQELRTAQEIQHTFLPKEVPVPPGWQLVPFYQSAREVGGDFYDFLPFADGRLGIVIGDVADKGVPAALVMTATRTMLRTAAQEGASPAQVLARVNDLLFNDIPPGMFVTCFYALLDPASGRMHFANAGHEPPFRQAPSGAIELWATGMPLGMMPETSYEEYETVLVPGESLLFYSDGLVEAHNRQREMFGFARLQSLLAGQNDATLLVDTLLDELQRFTGDEWEQEDDVTLLVLHRAVVQEAPAIANLQEAETLG